MAMDNVTDVFFNGQALNLLSACNKNLSIVNTSQSLGHMPITTHDSDPLPCLTPTGQGTALP